MSAAAQRFPHIAAAPQSLPATADDVVRSMRDGPHRVLEIGEDAIAYWRFGQGPDLVFVHGWPVHAATFRHLIPTLARHFTCHLFDLPGAGQTTSATHDALSLTGQARSVGAVIDTLGLRDYAMIAHDSGAVMARAVAAEHGSRVRGLIVEGSEIPGHRPWFVQAIVLLAKIPGGLRLLRLALRSSLIRRSSLGFGGCFTDPDYVQDEFHELFVAPLLNFDRVYAGQMRLVHGLDFAEVDALREVHARIAAPVLLLWGERDPFFPVERARDMLEQFGGRVSLHEIPDAKLFAHEDHAAEFLAAALPFLQAVTKNRHPAGAEQDSSLAELAGPNASVE